MYLTNIDPMRTTLSTYGQHNEVNKVYIAYDLSIFKQISGNRAPNLKHVKRLTDSIKTYGMKCNPILVNEKMEVIDGQHRLMAAKEANSFVYFIVIKGYSLNEVHTLNLNQKNWTKRDFMEGYADMGIEPYVKLRNFINKNNDFNFTDCIALCTNTTCGTNQSLVHAINKNCIEVFEEGTWTGRNFELAQDWANKIRMIKQYYSNYIRSTFVGTMIGMFMNDNFDFNHFMHKLSLQPTSLKDCANREQYKELIEQIYNYRSKDKVNLRF